MSNCTNSIKCTCTYSCENHGKCCECIAYHRKSKQLPACYFPTEAEKTYNRSISYYIQLLNEGKL